ncbi:expressed protein [Echinococcus multilocularis]|uniref:Expressed protein n=1 Tax=Echinococcus multilocularis TaxID=6211 RepID=A0A068XZD3_ECHMU|nr:expressed protein [Echinococcus multilocularis]
MPSAVGARFALLPSPLLPSCTSSCEGGGVGWVCLALARGCGASVYFLEATGRESARDGRYMRCVTLVSGEPHMTVSTGPSGPRGLGKLVNHRRDRDRGLELFPVNEEFLVSASHKLALITSLPFVHTARRYYRLNGLVRSLDRRHCGSCRKVAVLQSPRRRPNLVI